MPYATMEDVNPAIKGIDPPVTLAQANIIAGWADEIEDVESPWAVAIANWKKAYVVEDGSWVKRVEEVDMGELSEALAGMSLGEQERLVRAAFQAEYGQSRMDESWRYWVRDIFIAPSEFGNALVVEDNKASRYYLISYSEDGEKIVFADPPTWKTVVPTYRVETTAAEADDSPSGTELETVKLAETYAGVELLTEGIAEADAQGPLTIKIQPIRPGFGNAKHNNYYPAAMLKRDARVMIGAKMYETNHKQKDKSTRTWVSTVTDVLGFSGVGAPICEVVVHDPNFAQRVRNLDKANLLDKLECSLWGNGKAKRNQMVEGRKANVIEALMPTPDIDWVTKAGAGGKALAIAESDKDGNMEEQEVNGTETPTEEAPQKDAVNEVLGTVPVLKALLTSGLPQAAQERLAEGGYADEDTLKTAIDAEKVYLEAARPSEGGRPFGMGGAEPKREEDEKPLAERETAIVDKYIGR